MTDEAERPVADLAAEIMSADRASTPAKDAARDYLVWAYFGIIFLVAVTALIVLALSHPA